MTPVDAAKLIGCSISYCRLLIRTKKLRATVKYFQGRPYYEVSQHDAEKFRDTLKKDPRGCPRGQKRKTDPSRRKQNVK